MPHADGPDRTHLAQALQDYALERLPFLKGAKQDACRINTYLRLAGLATVVVTPVAAGAPKKDGAAADTVYFDVALEPYAGERRIPKGLAAHRKGLLTKTAGTEQHRRFLATRWMADITRQDLQVLVDAMRRDDIAPATILQEKALLSVLFNHARKIWRWALLHAERFTLLQAPLLRPAAKKPVSPVNYADMLLQAGYGDGAALAGALAGWRTLIELVRPALLVYNHAPTALLAARMTQCPVLLTGTGFEIPPAVAPLPSFRPWQDTPDSMLHDTEAALLAQINPHLARCCGQAPLARLCDLFPPEQVQLTTFAELDPFGPRPRADYIGPVHALSSVPAIAWQGSAARRIFAYLRPGVPGCENLLAALQALDAEVICAAPGLPPEWQARHGRIRFLPHPVDLAALLPQADLVITYGAGTIATALLAGVPVLLAPQVVEQYLAGLPLERTGAGRMLRAQRTAEQCASLLHELLTDARYREAARRFAQNHSDFSTENALRRQWQAVATRPGCEPLLPTVGGATVAVARIQHAV
ncbi:MAG: hypothetical protein OJF60_000046 [Burkholderiaceae bacterium]|jgi:hypothetical protein|nr:MAG: hypothetical protein OJF60_000046 [Burkholderiaceae bacterium]